MLRLLLRILITAEPGECIDLIVLRLRLLGIDAWRSRLALCTFYRLDDGADESADTS